MTEGTENATVESRLTAVETKTDRLIKDVEGCRGEIKELRDIVEANDKALRNDMQAMESRLIARQDETASAFRDDLRATENSLRQEIQGTAKELRDEIQGTAPPRSCATRSRAPPRSCATRSRAPPRSCATRSRAPPRGCATRSRRTSPRSM